MVGDTLQKSADGLGRLRKAFQAKSDEGRDHIDSLPASRRAQFHKVHADLQDDQPGKTRQESEHDQAIDPQAPPEDILLPPQLYKAVDQQPDGEQENGPQDCPPGFGGKGSSIEPQAFGQRLFRPDDLHWRGAPERARRVEQDLSATHLADRSQMTVQTGGLAGPQYDGASAKMGARRKGSRLDRGKVLVSFVQACVTKIVRRLAGRNFRQGEEDPRSITQGGGVLLADV